jgi:hypothetical protein
MIMLGRSLLAALLLTSFVVAADTDELQGRRQRAAAAFSDEILLIHARPAPDEDTDGFRQDPAFYYLTGLENTAGVILANDGRFARKPALPPHSRTVLEDYAPRRQS